MQRGLGGSRGRKALRGLGEKASYLQNKYFKFNLYLGGILCTVLALKKEKQNIHGKTVGVYFNAIHFHLMNDRE